MNSPKTGVDDPRPDAVQTGNGGVIHELCFTAVTIGATVEETMTMISVPLKGCLAKTKLNLL